MLHTLNLELELGNVTCKTLAWVVIRIFLDRARS